MARHGRLAASALLTAALLSACADGATAPSSQALQALLGPASCLAPRSGRIEAGGHPSLGLQAEVPLDGLPFAVAISRNGVVYVTQLLASSAVRGELPSISLSAPFPVGGIPSQVRMSPDGRTAYVGNQDSRTISVVDVATNTVTSTISVPAGSTLTIGLGPDGKTLYALTDFHGVYVINVEKRAVTDSIPAAAVGTILAGVAFHPFSPCAYIGARDDGTVSTVDLRTNRVVRTVAVSGGRIQNLAVSRDGARLFATDIERSKLIVWDLPSGAETYQEFPIGSPVSRNAFDVAVTPDNTQIYVSTLADGKVFILNQASGAPIATLATGGSARYIGFDAAGRTAVIANEAGWVNYVGVGSPPPPPSVCEAPPVGTPPSGRTHPALTPNEAVPLDGLPFAVAVSHDVAYVTQLLAASAVRADLPSTTLSAPFAVGDIPSQVRMSPDGATAYVGNQDARTITFVNVATNTAFATVPVPGGSILTIGLSPDGKRLYALTDYTGVFIIDVATRSVVAQITAGRTGSLLAGVAFHPFSPCMYIAARDAGTVSTVDLGTNRVVRTVTVAGGRIQNLAVSRDGARLFATDIGRSKLIAWDLAAGASTYQEFPIGTPVDRNAFDVAVTPDNTQVYVSTLADGKVFILNQASGAPIAEFATGGRARYVGFSASGNAAVVANEAGWVNFIGVASPPPPPSICETPTTGTPPSGRTHPAATANDVAPVDGLPFAIAQSHDVAYVTRLLAASAVRADLPSTTLSAPFAVGDIPSQVRMSPDGATAYVGNQDARTITFVHVATNTAFATVSVPGGSILTIGLSPDGSRLYALTDYTGVFIVDTDTRSVIGHISAASTGSLLAGVAFHPFSPCMYIAARDEGAVRTIDLTTNRVVRRAAVAGGQIQNVAVSLDGGSLYGTDIGRSKLITWDLTSPSSGYAETDVGTPTSRNVFDVAVTPDNAQLYVSTLSDGAVYVFDRATRVSAGSIVTGGSARYIGFNGLGSYALVANESGWVNFIH
jgi:YVTN family beta-propeller protein